MHVLGQGSLPCPNITYMLDLLLICNAAPNYSAGLSHEQHSRHGCACILIPISLALQATKQQSHQCAQSAVSCAGFAWFAY